MRAALSAGGTNAILALVAPQYQQTIPAGAIMRLDSFARPLSTSSSIVSREAGNRLPVWSPHYGVLPGGDTVEIIKVSGQWYFTGKVHLD